MNKHTRNNFTIYHQNICGLLNKKDELLYSLTGSYPQIICITEHHLMDEEMEVIPLHPYTLGAKFCRRKHKSGAMCILIQDNIQYTNINVDRYSSEKDIEICALANFITNSSYTKFLGVTTNSTLSWNTQFDLLMKILSMACSIIRNAKTYMWFIMLLLLGYDLWNYIVRKLVAWSHNFFGEGGRGEAIRIMEGRGKRVLCRNFLKKLQILLLTSQYILSLLMFVVQNKNFFSINNENQNLRH